MTINSFVVGNIANHTTILNISTRQIRWSTHFNILTFVNYVNAPKMFKNIYIESTHFNIFNILKRRKLPIVWATFFEKNYRYWINLSTRLDHRYKIKFTSPKDFKNTKVWKQFDYQYFYTSQGRPTIHDISEENQNSTLLANRTPKSHFKEGKKGRNASTITMCYVHMSGVHRWLRFDISVVRFGWGTNIL